MSRKQKVVAGVLISLLTLLVGSVFALSNIALFLGTIPQYDFGTAGPGYPVPATVQIHAFTMKPGDTVPWHYHKALSYVILAHGSITEQHLVGPGSCESEEFTTVVRSPSLPVKSTASRTRETTSPLFGGQPCSRSAMESLNSPRVQSGRSLSGTRTKLQLRGLRRRPFSAFRRNGRLFKESRIFSERNPSGTEVSWLYKIRS